MAELKTIPRGYNTHVVEILEELLEEAKRGDVIEIVAMTKRTDRTWGHRWSGTDNTIELIGAFEVMKDRQFRRIYE